MVDQPTAGRAAEEREEEAHDLSGAEYLSHNDRDKTSGYNGVPHRPQRPIRAKQVRAARSGARRQEEDAG